jgi:hypothetical protein
MAPSHNGRLARRERTSDRAWPDLHPVGQLGVRDEPGGSGEGEAAVGLEVIDDLLVYLSWV